MTLKRDVEGKGTNVPRNTDNIFSTINPLFCFVLSFVVVVVVLLLFLCEH